MNNMIIASAHKSRLSSWQAGLDGFADTVGVVNKLTTLSSEVMKSRPKVLLLDLDLIGSNNVHGLRNVFAETRTIVIGAISEEMEWELLKAGVRGCCRSDSDPKFIRQVVQAVQQGELWIRRTLTCRLIDELGKTTVKSKSYQASFCLLNKLTQREYDIAVRVGNGENNKQIAKACAITERTVKAHLTEVFQKLGVTDRLNLALVLSANGTTRNPGDSDIQLGNRFEILRSREGAQNFL